jgi:hypothetical protein
MNRKPAGLKKAFEFFYLFEIKELFYIGTGSANRLESFK